MISSMIRSTMNTAFCRALRGDPQEAPARQRYVLSRREEQVQNAGEHNDEHHRLQPPHQGFDPLLGRRVTHTASTAARMP